MAKQSARPAMVAPDNLLKMYPHCLFRPPEQVKRRRGPLPRGVVSIKSADRLRVGALAEVVGSCDRPENNGTRVLIVDFDPKDPHCWLTKSLGGAIRCDNGSLSRDVWFKPKQLRRLWTGLSANERIQLRLRRAS